MAAECWSCWTCHGVIRSRGMALKLWPGDAMLYEHCSSEAARRYVNVSRQTSRSTPWYSFSFGGHLDLSLMRLPGSLIHHRGHFSHLKNKMYGIIKFQVVQHELIIVIVECYFPLAYSSTHSQIYHEISDWWNTFSMVPAGRRSTEAPSKTLPWTHHHQYAVLHSKAAIGIWVERR